jgi:FAD/FMN-containing dehydrogenase
MRIAAIREALAPWDTGSASLNFTDDTVDPARFYGADAYARLRRIKAEVDPERRFRGNHAIDAA